MPKKTFFNLPKEKKESLIQAAMKEFSRVPLSEASISNIINDAGIPRGSFYQYFEDKEDIFFFLLDDEFKRSSEKFMSIIAENNGDLFDSFIVFFRYLITDPYSHEKRKFFRNIFLNMNYKVENAMSRNMIKENNLNRYSEIVSLINKEKLNVANEREMNHVMKIMVGVMRRNIIEKFANDLSCDEAVENYTFEIALLKKGLYKEIDK
ncbi:TetR/AcrR family transcriptional regulator [Scopulibacillus cellulosilyticus]|uniref:TetR/AcrR family transcriptional regulator n=1 Tax=Scopulibacillus cellulosilyticus TaxID=2665665 RepID=A0ABW2Q0S1_9BACL